MKTPKPSVGSHSLLALALAAVLAAVSGPKVQAAGSDEASKPAPPAEAAPDASSLSVMPMWSQMQRMHEEMQAIHNASDPAERRRLMREHMEAMQGMMQMMHGMMAGQGMMMGRHGQGEPGSMRGPMMGGGAPAPDSDRRLDMLEQRLNMMQMMMDQLLQTQREMLKE